MKQQGNFEHELIESVGIELEFSNFDRQCKRFNQEKSRRLPRFKIIHDASCETPAELFADTSFTIEFDNEKDKKFFSGLLQQTIIGGEIVSPIVHSLAPEWFQEVEDLCDLLYEFGEDEESKRDAFHVHVNVSRSIPLRVMKNLLRLTATFEAILFRLGGMGRENRGDENHHCFSRPFLGNGPPIVYYSNEDDIGRNYPILNYTDLMKAKTKEDFFHRYGNSFFWGQKGKKYVTPRYMCVNFYPVITQGSFEFRTANKTLNPEYIVAWTNFCKAFVEKAFWAKDDVDYEDKVRPLYENREISDDEFLLALSYLTSLDEDTNSVLLEIWQNSPTSKFDNLPRFSHLKDPTSWGGPYLPNSLNENIKIHQAEFIDIHDFQERGAVMRGGRYGENIPHDLLADLMNRQREQMGDEAPIRMGGENVGQIRVGPEIDDVHLIHSVPVIAMRIDWTATYDNGDIELSIKRINDNDVKLDFTDFDNDSSFTRFFENPVIMNLDYIIEQYHDQVNPEEMMSH